MWNQVELGKITLDASDRRRVDLNFRLIVENLEGKQGEQGEPGPSVSVMDRLKASCNITKLCDMRNLQLTRGTLEGWKVQLDPLLPLAAAAGAAAAGAAMQGVAL